MNLLDRLLAHNHWTTRQLLEHCRALAPDQWTRVFEIGPGTLQATFSHLIGAMGRWAESIDDRPRVFEVPADPSPDDLLAALDAAAEALDRACRAIHDAKRLDETMEFVTAEHETYAFTRGTAIAHVLTHGMHHRAQILNMLRHVNSLPRIDGDVIEWELLARAQLP